MAGIACATYPLAVDGGNLAAGKFRQLLLQNPFHIAALEGLAGLTIYALATDVRMREPALAVAKEPPPVRSSRPR